MIMFGNYNDTLKTKSPEHHKNVARFLCSGDLVFSYQAHYKTF